jgi:hypothetical protein
MAIDSRALLLIVLLAAGPACDPFGTDSGDSGSKCYSDGCDISGYVKTEEGAPLEGVKVELSGGGGGYVVTDKNGYYLIPRNIMLRNYCVTPSKGPWSFDPGERCYKKLDQNHFGQDFVAARIESFDISGYVVDERPMPVGGILVHVEGGEDDAVNDYVRTNSSGFYAARNLRGREDYCLTPIADGYVFEPVERCYTYLDSTHDSENFLAIEPAE